MLIETTTTHKNNIETHKLCSNDIFSLLSMYIQWSYLFLINIKFNEKFTRHTKKINFFVFFLCYAFTLSMALNHVFKSQNVKLWRRWLQNDYSLSLAPSYMKSASIFSLQNAQLQCAIMEVSMYTELWKTVNFFFLQRYATFLYFYFIFPSSTSISIRLSRGISFQ